MSHSHTILNTKDVYITSPYKNRYMMHVVLENPTVNISNIINFKLLELLYEINKHDIIEKMDIQYITWTEACVYIEFYHFFKEIGIPKKGVFLKLNYEFESVPLVAYTIQGKSSISNQEKNHVSIIDIININITGKPSTFHEVQCTINIEGTHSIPLAIEPLIANIIKKMVIRLKKSIYSLSTLDC